MAGVFYSSKWKFLSNFFSLYTTINNVLLSFYAGGAKARAEVDKRDPVEWDPQAGLSCSLSSAGEEQAVWDVSALVQHHVCVVRGESCPEHSHSPRYK